MSGQIELEDGKGKDDEPLLFKAVAVTAALVPLTSAPMPATDPYLTTIDVKFTYLHVEQAIENALAEVYSTPDPDQWKVRDQAIDECTKRFSRWWKRAGYSYAPKIGALAKDFVANW